MDRRCRQPLVREFARKGFSSYQRQEDGSRDHGGPEVGTNTDLSLTRTINVGSFLRRRSAAFSVSNYSLNNGVAAGSPVQN